MKRRPGVYNPKRRIAPADSLQREQLVTLAAQVKYGGNPEHKKSPADYELVPPAAPRPGKMLCDGSRAISKAEALALVKTGILKGMISVLDEDGWPQNIWCVSEAGELFEAQLENREKHSYHGYPMALDDPFRNKVNDEWARR